MVLIIGVPSKEEAQLYETDYHVATVIQCDIGVQL